MTDLYLNLQKLPINDLHTRRSKPDMQQIRFSFQTISKVAFLKNNIIKIIESYHVLCLFCFFILNLNVSESSKTFPIHNIYFSKLENIYKLTDDVNETRK